MTRLLVFEDSVYRREGDRVWTDRAFLHFASQLVGDVPDVTMLGRLHPEPGRSHYPLPDGLRFVGLPHYRSLARLSSVPALLRSLGAGWRELGRADVAWLMGPHPLALLLALLAPLRGTRVVLGVRQDLPAYVRGRHPDRPSTHRVADLLEAIWRRLAGRHAVVAVGRQLASGYVGAARLLELEVSLVPANRLLKGAASSGGPRKQLLTVGRLDTEKNPLLLADVLLLLHEQDASWRLVVCGEGPLARALQHRLEALGVGDHAELVGYLPVDGGLLDLYRGSDVFLHVSWTEGVPQVLLEAWASGLPVVATAVGGVPQTASGAALLVPPGDAAAAATAVRRLVEDVDLRDRLIAAGRDRMAQRTLEVTLARLARFLCWDGARPAGSESAAQRAVSAAR